MRVALSGSQRQRAVKQAYKSFDRIGHKSQGEFKLLFRGVYLSWFSWMFKPLFSGVYLPWFSWMFKPLFSGVYLPYVSSMFKPMFGGV